MTSLVHFTLDLNSSGQSWIYLFFWCRLHMYTCIEILRPCTDNVRHCLEWPVSVLLTLFWPHRAKTCLLAYADNESADQTFAQSDQHLQCSITESLDTTECTTRAKVWIILCACADDANPHILLEDTFSLDAANLNCSVFYYIVRFFRCFIALFENLTLVVK